MRCKQCKLVEEEKEKRRIQKVKFWLVVYCLGGIVYTASAILIVSDILNSYYWGLGGAFLVGMLCAWVISYALDKYIAPELRKFITEKDQKWFKEWMK